MSDVYPFQGIFRAFKFIFLLAVVKVMLAFLTIGVFLVGHCIWGKT
jgi:uncharacterized membrane protein